MKPYLIHVKLRDKNEVNLSRIYELFKLSVENNIFNLSYNRNIKENSNHNLELFVIKNILKRILEK